jgi:hypothetical protein
MVRLEVNPFFLSNLQLDLTSQVGQRREVP